ncbi:hypothetical protein F511_35992 [Dorcoceras hygrometricum]|uniref:Triacylglycerol lipase n=1 Tax=Dorcoceras hygrometricum TaxID=472368 RepID=A0A2Z7BUR1_9LAMI|nr:hypothetical protein F511_35992 [Dorcoceras hygrometricum]
MAQYQILARKPLGPYGTDPKQTLEVKTVSQHHLGFAVRRPHSGAPPPVPHAAHATARNSYARWLPPARTARAGGLQALRSTVRDNRARWPASARPLRAATVRMVAHAARSYSAPCVQLQCVDAGEQKSITDSACKNQLVMVSVQYGPFNTYIPIRSTTIDKSRVARDPITMHTSWRSNSDIVCVTRVSMTFQVAMANLYNQDLGLIHSTYGNHLESPNEGSSIDHQVTIHLHAQNITMFPTNETWYFASQKLVSSSGGLILILTAQSTRNEFRIHSDY